MGRRRHIKTKQHDPSDWIIAQCKDWTTDPITPAKLFWLCTVAFACRDANSLSHNRTHTAN